MKYLVHLSMPIRNGIGGDNLRGEPRTERHIFAALVESGKEVYTSDYPDIIWQSGESPSNLHKYSDMCGIENTTYISHGAPNHTTIYRKAENYILHMFNPHLVFIRDEIKTLMKTSNVLITTSFLNNLDTLKKDYGSDNVVLIEGPAAPDLPIRSKSFKPTYLLWSYRNFYEIALNNSSWLESLFNWCASKLKQDVDLRVGIVVGLYPRHVSKEFILDWFWGLGSTSFLRDLKNRVDIYWDIDWNKMMELNSKAKVIISPAESAGGPPYEAAISGVPVILSAPGSPYSFPGVITSNGIGLDFIHKLEGLMSDINFYCVSSELYYKYVKENATYSAYVGNLDKELEKRGW